MKKTSGLDISSELIVNDWEALKRGTLNWLILKYANVDQLENVRVVMVPWKK